MSDRAKMPPEALAPRLASDFALGEGFGVEDVAMAMSAIREKDVMIFFVAGWETGRPLCIAGSTERALGQPPSALIGSPDGAMRLIGANDAAEFGGIRQQVKDKGRVLKYTRLAWNQTPGQLWRVHLTSTVLGGREVLVGTLMPESSLLDGYEHDHGLRVAVNQAHEGLALTNPEGIYTFINHEHVTILGYDSADELIGRSWRVLYEDEEAAFIEHQVFPLLTRQGFWHGRIKAKRRDGSHFSQSLTLSMLPTGGLVCNCTDCSEEVAMEAKLVNSEALFRRFLDSMTDGVWIRDLAGQITFINAKAKRFLGPNYEKIIADTASFFGAEFSDRMGKFEREVFENGQAVTYDQTLVMGGRDYVFQITKSPLSLGGSSTVSHICTVAQDVTETRKAAFQAQEASRRRQEFMEMQREFISLVSHEFRTPLTAIQGTRYLLAQKFKDSSHQLAADAMRLLNLQEQAIATLKEQVDQVLLLNRIEHMTTEAPAKPLVIREFLEGIVSRFNTSLPRERVKTTLAGPPDWSVMVHESLLRSAVENLISNGLKYSPGDSMVEVELVAGETDWQIAVSDRGRGIPLADQASLFQPFFRAGNVGSVPGTGLGLTIVKRVAEFHQGRLEFTSAPGKGTRFILTFPLHADAPESLS